MRALVFSLAVAFAAGCTAQTPADAPAPAATLGLEAVGLVDRARALVPFVGGDLEDAQAALGAPSQTGGSATAGRTALR